MFDRLSESAFDRNSDKPLAVGNQTVYNADSRSMRSIPSGTIGFFMTSPPYWHLKDYGSPGQIGQSSYSEYLSQLNTVWTECYRFAKRDAVLVIDANSRRHQKEFFPIAFDIVANMKGWRLWDHVVWYIPNALPQPKHYIERLLDNKFESCLVFTKDGSSNFKFHKPRVPQKYAEADPRSHKKNVRGRCIGNVIRIPAYRPPNVKELGYHVAAYPEELVAFFLECYTDPGDRVLDPFLGSGTTLKVCQTMGRQGIGFEMNKESLPLITGKIQEQWEVPDWRNLDILHSSTSTPGALKPRKIQFSRRGRQNTSLLPFDERITRNDPVPELGDVSLDGDEGDGIECGE